MDLEKDERNELKIEVNFTRAKLFNSLIRNIPKMFPNEILDCELVNEEKSHELYIKIKKTTLELRLKLEAQKVREEVYYEL